jgi:hypothetical protein
MERGFILDKSTQEYNKKISRIVIKLLIAVLIMFMTLGTLYNPLIVFVEFVAVAWYTFRLLLAMTYD